MRSLYKKDPPSEGQVGLLLNSSFGGLASDPPVESDDPSATFWVTEANEVQTPFPKSAERANVDM